MKHNIIRYALTLIPFLSFLNTACVEDQRARLNDESNSLTIFREDSLRAAQDSVKKFNDAEQGKTIGEIPFGISSKQFNSQSAKFLEKHKKDFTYFLGNYEFVRINGSYYKGKLWDVDVEGDYISYEYYGSALVDQLDYLQTILTKKYGKYTYGDGLPPVYRTDKNSSYLVYGWSIGTKDVQIRVSDHGAYYSIDMRIYQPKISALISKESAVNDDSAAINAANSL